MATNIGIDLGGSKVRFLARVNDDQIVSQYPTGISFTPDMLYGLIIEFCIKESIIPETIGIGVPGLVKDNKIVECEVLPLFKGLKPSDFKIYDKIPTFLNDVNAGLLDIIDSLPKSSICLLVMAGTSIGASFSINGNLYIGSTGLAGELGYYPLKFNNSIKNLVNIVGGQSIISRLKLSPTEINEYILNEDSSVMNEIKMAGYTLGCSIAGMINFLNPSHVFLGGGTFQYAGYLESTLDAIEKHCLPELFSCCIVSEATSGNNIVAKGALVGGIQEAKSFNK